MRHHPIPYSHHQIINNFNHKVVTTLAFHYRRFHYPSHKKLSKRLEKIRESFSCGCTRFTLDHMSLQKADYCNEKKIEILDCTLKKKIENFEKENRRKNMSNQKNFSESDASNFQVSKNIFPEKCRLKTDLFFKNFFETEKLKNLVKNNENYFKNGNKKKLHNRSLKPLNIEKLSSFENKNQETKQKNSALSKSKIFLMNQEKENDTSLESIYNNDEDIHEVPSHKKNLSPHKKLIFHNSLDIDYGKKKENYLKVKNETFSFTNFKTIKPFDKKNYKMKVYGSYENKKKEEDFHFDTAGLYFLGDVIKTTNPCVSSQVEKAQCNKKSHQNKIGNNVRLRMTETKKNKNEANTKSKSLTDLETYSIKPVIHPLLTNNSFPKYSNITHSSKNKDYNLMPISSSNGGFRLGERKILTDRRRLVSNLCLMAALFGILCMIIETELVMARVYTKVKNNEAEISINQFKKWFYYE